MRELPTIVEEDIEKALEELTKSEEPPSWIINRPIGVYLAHINPSPIGERDMHTTGFIQAYAIFRQAARRANQSLEITERGIDRKQDLHREITPTKCVEYVNAFMEDARFANLRKWIDTLYKGEPNQEVKAGALDAYLMLRLEYEP